MAQRDVTAVDGRGRISLSKYGIKDTNVVVESLPDGAGVVIQKAVVLTEAEAAHDRNPAAQEALARGLADAAAGRVSDRQL